MKKYTVHLDKYSRPIHCDNLAKVRVDLGAYFGIVARVSKGKQRTTLEYAKGYVVLNRGK